MLRPGPLLISALVVTGMLAACSKAPTRTGFTSGKSGASSGNSSGSTTTGDSGAANVPTTLVCSGDTTIDPGPAPLRRLTRSQYVNSVRDLLGAVNGLDSVLTSQRSASAFGTVPSDVSNADVEAYQSAGTIIAAALVADKNKLNAVANCDSASVKRDCAKTSLQALATRAYRSPIASTDVDSLMVMYDLGVKVSHEHGMELAISAILQSPRFLYQPEIGTGESVSANAVKLSGYEVATRLAYAVWDSTPDAKLLKAAEAGELSTAAGVKNQLAWMIQDPKGQNLYARFLAEWTRMEDLSGASKNLDLYPAWKDQNLRNAVAQQATAFFNDVVTNQGAKLSALLTSPRVMVNKDIASYYGGGVTDSAFKAVEKTDGSASGLLSLPAMMTLTANASESSPVYRGRFVRQSLLCQTLPPAPANIPAAPEVNPNSSTRERVKEHESNPTCAGCHVLMDPIGLGFENFDAIGRWRSTDGGSPVDASGELTGARGAEGKFNGVAELGKKLAASPEVQECMTRQWFRFMLDRFEQDVDSCALRKTADAFTAAGTDIKSLPAAFIGSDAFLYRRPIKN